VRVLLIALALVACRATGSGPYEPSSEAARNPALAQELSSKAADLLESDPVEAERLLRDALSADLFFGPAHNNLGVVFLKAGKLYEAAGEFEWARKLMPGHPDPRMNLALTLEQAGRTDEAIQTYKTALEVFPGHVPTEQALARLYLRSGNRSDSLTPLLERVALHGESPAWRTWARSHLLRSD
jgi:Flp pilus assembly protein TadD